MSGECLNLVLSLTGGKYRCRETGLEVQEDCRCEKYKAIPETDIKLELEEGQLGIF